VLPAVPDQHDVRDTLQTDEEQFAIGPWILRDQFEDAVAPIGSSREHLPEPAVADRLTDLPIYSPRALPSTGEACSSRGALSSTGVSPGSFMAALGGADASELRSEPGLSSFARIRR
jgi:hypothetical protein